MRLFTPDYRVRVVWELTPERLRQWGVSALLLDVDCTLKRYSQTEAVPEAAAWIEQLRISNFRLCLVSNGLPRRIEPFARRFELPFVARAMKPAPWGVQHAIEKLAVPPREIAIVGDQIFADVLAGRLAGIRTILVDPIHPEEEPWFTKLKRLPERLMLAHMAEEKR
jgi:uncharacterized protein